ncbi:hypothetical protein ABC383_26490 [Noviherbaspirillum sp. 1P10PC]|uniref:hypothetical protein n=1 Tax=Noviherbaspirillum sp. 1P10PC TaxID=3132292 RepID=UPI0039A1BCE0
MQVSAGSAESHHADAVWDFGSLGVRNETDLPHAVRRLCGKKLSQDGRDAALDCLGCVQNSHDGPHLFPKLAVGIHVYAYRWCKAFRILTAQVRYL